LGFAIIAGPSQTFDWNLRRFDRSVVTYGSLRIPLYLSFRRLIQVSTAASLWAAMLLFSMECERGIIFDPLVDSPDGHHPD
jgi:hypothetical protein